MLIEEKIKSIREAKGFTQEYMAEQLGITQAAYSKIESGQTKLTMNKITDIATIFEMDVNDLMSYDTQKYFNSFNNVKGSNNGSTITNTDSEILKKLYEDKIVLLEKLLNATEKELIKYREKYGEL
ncbi:MAG TPA: helix-turn-helix transcriptional regulator [Flavobacterium sp.]|nr:helix-turn-helix transcriptional regulator [Flavobacterium sp.]